jgi:hypothetical protein
MPSQQQQQQPYELLGDEFQLIEHVQPQPHTGAEEDRVPLLSPQERICARLQQEREQQQPLVIEQEENMYAQQAALPSEDILSPSLRAAEQQRLQQPLLDEVQAAAVPLKRELELTSMDQPQAEHVMPPYEPPSGLLQEGLGSAQGVEVDRVEPIQDVEPRAVEPTTVLLAEPLVTGRPRDSEAQAATSVEQGEGRPTAESQTEMLTEPLVSAPAAVVTPSFQQELADLQVLCLCGYVLV